MNQPVTANSTRLPTGIDPLIWDQAKLDNPNPEELIPVPMIGFTELHNRLRHQEQQTKLHQSRLNVRGRGGLEDDLSVSLVDISLQRFFCFSVLICHNLSSANCQAFHLQSIVSRHLAMLFSVYQVNIFPILFPPLPQI